MSRKSDAAWVRMYRCEAVTEQGGKCFYCLRPITPSSVTADHLWPKSRRGGNAKSNIVAACRDCNKAKGNMPPWEFLKAIKKPNLWKGYHPEIWMVWASRRIWKKANRSCDRIARSVSINDDRRRKYPEDMGAAA